jgi:hypothetical protein
MMTEVTIGLAKSQAGKSHSLRRANAPVPQSRHPQVSHDASRLNA